MAKILLNSKEIDMYAANKLGHNVLHIAAMNSQRHMMQLLLRYFDQTNK